MVGITINLNNEIHKKLKNRASNNMRSMKNELLMIIQNSLNNSNIEQVQEIRPEKKLIDMENTFVM